MEHPLPITLGLFWIGLIAVAIFWTGMRVYGSRRSALILMGISTAGFIAGAVVHPFSGHSAITRATGDAAAPAVNAPPTVSAPAASVPAAAIAAAAGVAKPLRYTVFSTNNETRVAALQIDTQPALGSIDLMGFTDAAGNLIQPKPLVVAAGAYLELQGWVLAPTTQAPPAGVFVLVDGTNRVGGDYRIGIARPDVEKAFHNTAAAKAGFSLLIHVAGLAAGAHKLQLVATQGNAAFTVPATYDFTIQ